MVAHREYLPLPKWLEEHRGLVSRNKLYKMVRANQIPHVKIGKKVLLPRNALDELLQVAKAESGATNG